MSVSVDLPIGSELAGYRIEALVGRGGMGVVYRAHDLALDRDVALKLLSPDLADDVSFRERFLRESRLAASLEHPNVVPIHDAGEVDGRLYIAMRLVEGTDLKALLHAEGALAPARALRIVEQVAGALDAAHARGLVHRDVKPSNVLVAADDHVYLADFGLSRSLGEAGASIGAAKSLGTIDYVAPEQIRGEEVDGRADVYALGCLLHECLTGEPPFRRSSDAAVLFAHLEEEPPTLPGLEQVTAKALAKDPDDRYQTCRELVEAARSALGLEVKQSRWPLAVASVGITLIGAALLAFFLTGRDGGVRAEPGADSLVRIDPKTNKVAETMAVGRKASGVAVGGGFVWVTNAADGNRLADRPEDEEGAHGLGSRHADRRRRRALRTRSERPRTQPGCDRPDDWISELRNATSGQSRAESPGRSRHRGRLVRRPGRANRRQSGGSIQGRLLERAGPHSAQPDQPRF